VAIKNKILSILFGIKKMKRTLSAYIIFAFLLTTFPGCAKLAFNIGLNLPNNPNPSEVVNQPDNSSEIETKDLTEKENWNEWVARRWEDISLSEWTL
jgi:hypothetical protein